MEELKKIYIDEIRLLQLFQDSVFYGLDFDTINYEYKSTHNFMQKKLFENIDDKIEIICKEKIYKKYIEKYLEIKIKNALNKDDYKTFKIIVDNERIRLLCEKYESKRKINFSKQFGFNGYIVSTFKDDKNNYILYQNVNNLLQFVEDFNDDIYCNIFKLEKDSIKYISKFPYKFAYDSVVNCAVHNEEELKTVFNNENKKRKSISSNVLKLEKETDKKIQNCISNMSLVYENSKDIYNYMVNSILKYPKMDEIVKQGSNIVDELSSIDTVQNDINEVVNQMTELEILKSQRLELIEMKKTTDEIIVKLQDILIS